MAEILVIGKYYPPFMGGIEDNTASIASALAENNSVTAVVNAHDGGPDHEEVMDGVRVIRRRPLATIASQPVALHLLRGIDLARYDIVHFHAPNPFASAMLLGALAMTRKRPVLYITHHMDIQGRVGLREMSLGLYNWLIRHSQAVIVTSMKNARISRDLPNGAPLIAVPLGIRPDRYVVTDIEREEAAAWRASLAGDRPLVGFLGRHARYKGLDILVRAVASIPGLHAAIAGDGPYRRQAEDLSRRLGVADRIHFLGGVDHRMKVKMLSVLDAFLFPSTEITEAFGVSQLEAMMCGAPVIASNLPTGVTDVAIDGQTALLCKPSDPVDLALQIERMLGDRPFAQRLSRQAKAHVMSSMTHERIQIRTRQVLEGILPTEAHARG